MCGMGAEIIDMIEGSGYSKNDILIVCALETEIPNGLSGWNLIYTGCGKVNATYELTKYIHSNPSPKLVINFGTAGSSDIPIHTLVSCSKFIQRDMDVTGLGFRIGKTPFDNLPHIIDFSHRKNKISQDDYVCGTGDNFVENITDELKIIDVFDMEAYALAKVCYKSNIDFISYKYITDNVNEKSADDWSDNCSKGVIEFKRVLKQYDNI